MSILVSCEEDLDFTEASDEEHEKEPRKTDRCARWLTESIDMVVVVGSS